MSIYRITHLHTSSLQRSWRGIALLCLLLCPMACDKVPINGPLDGMWQLMEIEHPQARKDVKDQRVYISFQLHLTQWEDKLNKNILYAHFEHTADSMRFYDFAHNSAHVTEADDNAWLTPEEVAAGALEPWGIHTTDARFAVRRLDGSRLVLQREDTVLTFRKF